MTLFDRHHGARWANMSGMRHEFAVRFEPSSGSRCVPAQNYIQSLAAVLEAIGSLRATFAPRLAAQHKWPASQVKEALNFSIGPTSKGSLIVPLIPGGVDRGAPLGTDPIALEFWRESGDELVKTRKGKASYLTGIAADAFARASASAREGHSKIGLALRAARGEWRTTTALTPLEPYLRKHAERRRTGHRATIALTGQIASLTYDPPSFVLVTAAGRQPVKMPASLRDQAKEHWGIEVVVNVEASLSADGDVGDAHAVSIHRSGSAENAAAVFEQTFGALHQVWGTEEARTYIGNLRLRS